MRGGEEIAVMGNGDDAPDIESRLCLDVEFPFRDLLRLAELREVDRGVALDHDEGAVIRVIERILATDLLVLPLRGPNLALFLHDAGRVFGKAVFVGARGTCGESGRKGGQ